MFRRLLSHYSSTRSGQRAALLFVVTIMLSLGISSQIGIVRAALIFTPSTMPDGTVGTPYPMQTVTASGGVGVLTLTHTGNVPPGLNFDDASGNLTGTPSDASGSPYVFTVTATDTLGPSDFIDYLIVINPPPPLTLSPTTVPDGTAGVLYTPVTITPSGGVGPYTLTQTGTVPPGMSFVEATGVLSGTPTTAGPYTFRVTVTDSLLASTFIDYPITINPAALTLSPITVPDGTAGVLYTPVTITPSGGVGPYTLTQTGTVPPGMSFVEATGVLSGTPTTAGPYTFRVTVTDSLLASTFIDYPITISPPTALALTPTTVSDGTVGVLYTPVTITPSGGVGPYTLTQGGTIPPGMSFVPATGVLSGTPTTVGTYSFTVTVTDSTNVTLTVTYPITINKITLGGLPNGAKNVAYSQTITVTPAATYTFGVTVGTVPPGLTLSTAGVLSGTPTTIGTYTFTVQAVSAAGTGTRIYTIIISQPIYVSSPGPSSTIDVGIVQIGTAISTNLVISNNGLAPATLTINPLIPSAPITGPNAADFAITSPSPFQGLSIAGKVGQTVNSQTLTIRCIPSASGLLIATLTLKSNDPNNLTVTYTLTCTGSGTVVPTATPFGFVATATAFVIPPTAVLPATGVVTGVKGLAMRTGPYLGATLIGKAIPGAPYSILARSNDEGGGITWYLITTVDGVTGWVSGLYLNVTGNIDAAPFQGSIFDQIDGAPDTGISARAMSIIDIRRRPSGRAAILGQVPQGGTLHLMGRTRQNGGDFWVQVNYNGIIGWIPAAPIAVRGSTGKVPIR